MAEHVYTTIEGDTWDMIALDFYNDEYLVSPIMERNRSLAHYVIFPAGIELYVPIISAEAAASLPPWRR